MASQPSSSLRRGARLVTVDVGMSDESVKAEMRAAMDQVRSLRFFLVLGLVLTGLGLVLLIVSAFVAHDARLATIGAIGVAGVTVGLLTFAIRNLERYPLAIALTLALLQTANLIGAALSGEGWLIPAVLSALFWFATGQALRLRRLARAHPDHYLSKLMRGEVDPDAQGHRSLYAERKRARALRRRWTIAAVAGAFVVYVGIGVSAVLAFDDDDPEGGPLEPVLAEFRAAWNDSDVERVADLADPSERWAEARRIQLAQKNFEWGERLPPITEHDADPEAFGGERVRFRTEGGGDFLVTFRQNDDRWVWSRIQYRGARHWRP